MQLLQPQSRQERERESPSPALTLLQAAPLVLLQRSQHFKQTTQITIIYFTNPDLIQIVFFTVLLLIRRQWSGIITGGLSFVAILSTATLHMSYVHYQVNSLK